MVHCNKPRNCVTLVSDSIINRSHKNIANKARALKERPSSGTKKKEKAGVRPGLSFFRI
jgi:hypothetical protein